MPKSINKSRMMRFKYKGKEYQIVDRLVAYYLSVLKLRTNNYSTVLEADKILWDNYKLYLAKIQLCRSEANNNLDYIINKYKQFHD